MTSKKLLRAGLAAAALAVAAFCFVRSALAQAAAPAAAPAARRRAPTRSTRATTPGC